MSELWRKLGGKPRQHMGLPLEYLRARRSEIVRDWRHTDRPKKRDVKRWARQVSALNMCIAAMEAELVEQGKAR